MRKFALLFIALIVFLSGCLEGKEKIVTITKYQCYDGRIVSNLNNCPTSQQGAQPTPTTVTGTQTTTPTTKSKTTTSCPCTGVVKPKTTSTIKLGPLCTTDADCGQSTYGQIKCHNGDAYKVKNTPQCLVEKIDNQKHCKTLSELELSKECSDNERCVVGQGCVSYNED